MNYKEEENFWNWYLDPEKETKESAKEFLEKADVDIEKERKKFLKMLKEKIEKYKKTEEFKCKKCDSFLKEESRIEYDCAENPYSEPFFKCLNKDCEEEYDVIYPFEKDGDKITNKVLPKYNKE